MILQQLDRKNLSLELTEDIFVDYMKKYSNKTCDRFSARDAFVTMIDEWTHLRLCEFIYREKIYYPISSMDQSSRPFSKSTQKSNHQLLTTLFNAKNLEKHKSIKQLKKDLKSKFYNDRYEKDANMKTNGKHEVNEEHQESYRTVVLSFPKDIQQSNDKLVDEQSNDKLIEQLDTNIEQLDTSIEQLDTNIEQYVTTPISKDLEVQKIASELQNVTSESPNGIPDEQNVFIFHGHPDTNVKINQDGKSACDFCIDSVMKSSIVPEPTVLYTDKPSDISMSLSEPNDTQNSVNNEVWASISPEEDPFTDTSKQPSDTNSTTVPNSTCQIM
jgi:hypothetical protein